MDRIINKNQAELCGVISKAAEFSHESYGEKFYRIIVSVPRKSGYEDEIPVLVSDHLCKPNLLREGQCLSIKGQFRSFDKHDEDKNRLILSVFALVIDLLGEIKLLGEDISYKNKIELTGFICKEPTYRATPYEREISDVLLAVNRSYGKSDFIPCICWERNALFASDLAVGTQVELTGRIQSRKFEKRISDDEYEERIAYEVSVSTICVIGGEEDDCV